jgi:DNA modification methylase
MTLSIPLEEHQLLKIKLDSLKFDQTNPNELTEEQMEGLRKSMKKFGYLTPIIVDQNNMIADGEHRALIYKEFGFTEIPGFKVNLKDDIERRMLRQVMNKLHGEHDRQRDANELLQIFESKKLDELAQLIAQPKEDLQAILTKQHGIEFEYGDDFNVDKVLEDLVPITKLGDIWQLGQHRIICADCSDDESIAKLMQGKKPDMVFTDPPYAIMGSSTGFARMEDDNMIRPFFRSMFFLIKKMLKKDGHAYICCNWRSFVPMWQENKGLLSAKNLIVWYKRNARLGGMYSNSHEFIFFLANDYKDEHLTVSKGKVRTVYGETNVWDLPTNTNSIRELFAVKPVLLMVRAIRNSSDEGNIILDPFIGSGSTLIACEQTNRVCYGVEIDPHYCDVIIKRWEQYTGNKASLASHKG